VRAAFFPCAQAPCRVARLDCSGDVERHFHLLPYFGAIPVNKRVVVDGAWVFATGVTAGIDGALRLAAELRGAEAAQRIPNAPEPPFDSGTPETAPVAILQQARQSLQAITAHREKTAGRVAAQLGITIPDAGAN